MKRFLAWTLMLLLLCSVFASCTTNDQPTETDTTAPETLAAPQNVKISESGLITWDAVEHATSYTVRVGSATYQVTTNSYQVTNLDVDFKYSVVANAENYQSSASSAEGTYTATRIPPVDDPEIVVAISGPSEVRSGHQITLTAAVTGTDDQTVLWEITEGGEYASIDPVSGVLTAESGVEGSPIVTVAARSLQDESCVGSKVVTVVSKPELTQEMLDVLAEQTTISFDGYLNILLYNFGLYDDLYQTTSTTIQTAMDGTHWYAQYTDGNTGVPADLYFKNHNGLANQVGVSFMNEEEYFPMLTDDGETVSWIDSGLYNNFTGLTVADFTFNEENWRYEYTGDDETLMTRMIASANPYDFVPTNLALIINEGEIMGIYSKSADDYTVVSGYRAVMELTVSVNYGDTVEVPTIGKYPHDEIHDALNEAIANMQALTSYTLDFTQLVGTVYTSGYTASGFVETITADNCFFDPFSVDYDGRGNEIRTDTGAPYAYHKISDSLYNTVMWDGDLDAYEAVRAYASDFANAKPTFAFAGEIFTQYYVNEDGSITYYVDNVMSSVASTFYYGVGNDIQLYGLFATEGRTSSTSSFTPFVTVKDGYITEACFYFYLGTLYGVVEIEYSDFNTAELPTEIGEALAATPVRELPDSWSQLTIQVTDDLSPSGKEEEINAAEYLAYLFGSEELAAEVPFFGIPLGDTYGFGMTTLYMPNGSHNAQSAVIFYYDVPLDVDYTIESSLAAIREYLESIGYEADENGVYVKDGISVLPTDTNLDLMIYVWYAG